MIAVTSLAPGHKNAENQKAAIKSWKDAGFTVYSINSIEEIVKLGEYQVEFVETLDVGIEEYGKPYVRLNAFRDFVKQNGDALLVNSDILITGDIKASIEKAKDGMLVLQRYDYDKDKEDCKIFRSGFDAFYITQKLAKLMPDTKLALGQCHWDYWLPIVMIRKQIPIFTSKKITIMHKVHELQYDRESWLKTGRFFSNELNLSGRIEYNSMMAHGKILASLNVVW